MNNKSHKKVDSDERGFTLLFAVLVSTLVLAVGASIISMALRQVVLSGVGRDSQFAFYASNTGIECALYWDLNSTVDFATSSDSDQEVNIRCANSDITTEEVADGGGDAQTKFRIEFNDVGNNSEINNVNVTYCVDVYVKKTIRDVSGEQKRMLTSILARGYNTCDPENPRRIERGLELNY